ncbi:MAG: polysaccharide biosynthesis tyrosine autokinase [Bacteroidales bacterium]|nr:polysaccharide biosynthesis tyrosine autokinase [Bacteroidales bacterium]
MITEKVIEDPQNNPIDLKDFFIQVKKRWIYYASFLFICITLAVVYNKTSIPTYNVNTTILINDEEATPQIQPGNPVLSSLNPFTINSNFENEIYIFKSTPIIETAIKKLNFQVSYYERNYLGYKEIYEYSPFIIVFNQEHPQPVGMRFKIEIIDEVVYKISAKGKDVKIYNYATDKVINQVSKISIREDHTFNDSISNENYSFKVVLNKNFNLAEAGNRSYYFVFNNIKNLVHAYSNAIKIEPIKEDVNLAQIKIETPVINKTIEFLQSLTNEYINRSLEKRNFIAINTIDYIDSQLNNINDSLQRTEMKLQNFQASNAVMDISTKTNRLYDQMRELQSQKEQLDLRTRYYDYIKDYFESNQNISELIAPSSMGIDDPLLNNMIQQLIVLNNEKNNLIANNQEKSPYLKQLNIKIDNLKNSIFENVNYVLSTNDLNLTDINSKIGGLNAEINKLPRTSRELTGIERKFNVNDAIYTYLLQRKAESEISRASSLPNLEVIEPPAMDGDKPVSPMSKLNYLVALVLALVLPTAIFGISDYFNDYIKDEKSFERHLRYPLIGKIVHNYHKVDNVLVKFPNSSTSESFRHIRTNLPFFLKGKSNQIILITSSFGGEGKTFVSLNVASSLALYGKKTIMLDFDLRKPRLTEIFSKNDHAGISSYLINDASLDTITIRNVIDNLDFIPAGPIPPNPVELIAMEKTKILFSNLRNLYDYIIVDSPPVGIVTDSFVLMEHSGLNLLVARQDYTSVREYAGVQKELYSKGVRHLCVILNDVQGKHGKYGYGYYTKEQPSLSKKQAV